MLTVVYDETSTITVPTWVIDLASFHRWCESDDFPDKGRIWFLRGGVWADMSMEQLFSHNQVKLEVAGVVRNLVKREKLGRCFTDGARLANLPAEFSGVPDGVYVSFDTLRSGRAKYIEGVDGGYTRLEGIPDLVIEVVSRSSVEKDTEWLQKAYWEAQIPEYWLIDARRAPLSFDILRYTAKGYVATRKSAGWIKSAVLGKSFRLTQEVNGLGHPDYTLAVR